jgi:hypothetical protein
MTSAYYSDLMRMISLKLPDELLVQINKEAKRRSVTRSLLVRKILERAFPKRPMAAHVSCYDLARDLAGSLKGLPKDLADNPKYMEGFGE